MEKAKGGLRLQNVFGIEQSERRTIRVSLTKQRKVSCNKLPILSIREKASCRDRGGMI